MSPGTGEDGFGRKVGIHCRHGPMKMLTQVRLDSISVPFFCASLMIRSLGSMRTGLLLVDIAIIERKYSAV